VEITSIVVDRVIFIALISNIIVKVMIKTLVEVIIIFTLGLK